MIFEIFKQVSEEKPVTIYLELDTDGDVCIKANDAKIGHITTQGNFVKSRANPTLLKALGFEVDEDSNTIKVI